jgi:tetratricopeptide (TPR) repeat protein
MDGRKARVFASLCLLQSACLVGCVTPPPAANPETGMLPQAVAVNKMPEASTCAAYGSFREGEATAPHTPPEQRVPMLNQARAAFEVAIKTDPGYLPAYLGLARVFSALGDEARAQATYEKAAESHPKEPAVWYGLAMCHARLQRWDPACENLDKAVQLDHENRQYATALGFCLARAGRFEESLSVFTPLVGKAQACYKVAQMAHHVKRDDLAADLLRQAVQEKPDLTPARDMLAKLGK